MRVRAAVARSSTWRASASQTQNAVAYDISGACAAVGDLGAEAIAGHARQPGPSGRGGYEELPGREPPATNGRNQVAKIPDGRRASDGMRDGAAVPGPATMDPVLLGGAGGAIRTSGWSDSHQWVERFAPVGGAIRTSGWSTWPHDGNPRPLGNSCYLQAFAAKPGPYARTLLADECLAHALQTAWCVLSIRDFGFCHLVPPTRQELSWT
jgi:hypothetical protein